MVSAHKHTMQNKHTPGPWASNRSVFSSSATTEIHIGNPSHTCAVVYIDNLGKHKEEQEANARLIAAAPDMLAALSAYVAAINGLSRQQVEECPFAVIDCVHAARAAIAKATGATQDS